MDKNKTINVYFENQNLSYSTVTDYQEADLIIRADGTWFNKNIHKPKEKVTTYNLEEEISRLIINLGVPVNIRGYRYLLEAITMIINDPSIMSAVTKTLYPKVAILFNTLPSRAERGIRHAIEVAWMKGDAELQNKYFKYPEGAIRKKPSNSEFICCMAEHFKIQLRLKK